MQGVEGGTAESSGIADIFNDLTAHLTDSHSAFMKRWLRLVALEEEGLTYKRAKMWNVPGTDLPFSKRGRCPGLDNTSLPRSVNVRRVLGACIGARASQICDSISEQISTLYKEKNLM